MTGRKKKDLLQGTLELLVLRVLSAGSLHGYGIAKRIEQISDEALSIQKGSLYPALHRLEGRALIKAEWVLRDEKRASKVYSLTQAGKSQLEAELEQWNAFTSAVNSVIREA